MKKSQKTTLLLLSSFMFFSGHKGTAQSYDAAAIATALKATCGYVCLAGSNHRWLYANCKKEPSNPTTECHNTSIAYTYCIDGTLKNDGGSLSCKQEGPLGNPRVLLDLKAQPRNTTCDFPAACKQMGAIKLWPQ